MTPKQKTNFNRMLGTLKTIAKGYQTPDQLRKNSERDFGCDFDEAIEMSYENIQQAAKVCIRGIRRL